MIFELPDWWKAYTHLIQHIRTRDDNEDSQTSSSVLILCAMDADALCAARILSYLLRADTVPYQLRPCPSHSSLVHILSGLNNGSDEGGTGSAGDIGCVVMLNIGGMSNLTKFYARGEEENDEPILPMSTLTFVMDCHRPWHLANIHAGENIILFKEEPLEDDVPSDGDGLSAESESDSDSESDDSESDSDSEEEEFKEEEDLDNDNSPLPKKRKLDDESHISSSSNDETKSEQMPKEYDADEEDTQQVNLDPNDINDDRSTPTDAITQSNPQDDDSNSTSSTRNDNGNSSHLTPTSPLESTPQQQSTQTLPKTVELSFRQRQKARRDRISTYYYSGSYHRAPVSWIAYTLCRQLRFGDLGDLLWLACVGVTDAFLHARLDTGGYTEFVTDLRRHIQRLYPDDEVSRAMNAIHSTDGTWVGVSENGRILCQTEFRFMLLRHWSLLDAMMHSNFVGTKLQVWKEHGRFKLTEMLAKMGFPLHECKQPWAFMRPSLKRVLREAVLEHKEDFDLGEINYTGFIRVTGYKSLISASDMSYAVTALLESETPATISSHNTNGSNEMNPSHSDPEIIKSFNIAYDALNAKSTGIKSEGYSLSNLVNGGALSGSEGLGAGIRLAMQLQKCIISTGVGLVDKNAITRLKHFRYAYLYATGSGSSNRDGSSSGDGTNGSTKVMKSKQNTIREQNIFSRPLALCKLAHFLMDMHREKWINKNARPLVLIAENTKTDSFLIVGYHFADYEGDTAKNKFRKYFELTTKSMDGLCEVRLDSFEGNVVEVQAGNEQRFIEQLHYLMDAVHKME